MPLQAASGFLEAIFLTQLLFFSSSSTLPPLTNDTNEAREIAREAYPFFSPVIVNWRLFATTTAFPMLDVFIGFDKFKHREEVQAPNDNVIYSAAWLDLRQEPRVVTVPQIVSRYFSLQIIDGYTHNIGIISERTISLPAEGGRFVVAGPGNASVPALCSQEENGFFRAEGDFVYLIVRLQQFRDENVTENVTPIQQGFNIEKLSQFCDIPGPFPLPPLRPFRIPESALLSLDFFTFTNRIMGLYLTTHPTEDKLYDRLAKIGIIPQEPFPPDGLSDDVLRAIEDGILSGNADIDEELVNPPNSDQRNGWKVAVNPPQFGTRQALLGPDDLEDNAERRQRYLTRAAAARGGLYGLDPDEAFYPNTNKTFNGNPLNASGNRTYYIKFRPRTLPPILGLNPFQEGDDDASRAGFWSITMYDRETSTFVPNRLNRFSIGSRDLGTLCRYKDKSFPIVIQEQEPTEESLQSNWLPAPDGEFFLIARLYSPKRRAVRRPYLPPPVILQRDNRPLKVPTKCP